MDPYAVLFARSARKELERLSETLQTRILDRIERLQTDPRPSGCRKLEGADDLWRIRIGEYRVIYSVNDGRRIVDVIAIRHRSDAYR